jgi:DNA-binding MarR family transcriptional regulator
LGDEVAGLMGPLVREMHGHFRACAAAQGLAVGDAQALWLLALHGSTATKDLARALDIDPANASTLISRLERRGFVRRTPAPHDRRSRLVELTAKGRRARDALARCIAKRRPAFRDFTTAELTTFRDLLRRAASSQ